MKKKDIKYKWALFDNNLIHISEVTHEMRKLNKFRCQVSNEPMTAYLDGKYQKHFHHLTQNQTYNKETYLHETGKHLFYRQYKDALNSGFAFCLEYELEYQCNKLLKYTDIVCNGVSGFKDFDLTTKYKNIELEIYHDELKPDLILRSENNREIIFVEIAVTHESTEKKKLSGNRIIEIKLESESDLDLLKVNRISMKSQNIKFYNFNKKILNVDNCPTKYGYCKTYGSALKVDKDGIFEFLNDTLENLSEIKLEDTNSNYFIYEDNKMPNLNSDRFEYRIIKDVSEKGFMVRDCRVCKNSITDGQEWSFDRLYCRSYKMKIKRNYATDCDKILN
ncbi:MAG: hypothetical protein IPM42_13120 [Saprospiraceae bacterium]|nr:hypothetical protein [Saprospiraceae bacterium]